MSGKGLVAAVDGIIGGKYHTKGEPVTHLTNQDDIDAAKKAGYLEDGEGKEDVDLVDAAPSLTSAHQTKRVKEADNAADRKAAAAEEK